MANKLTNKNRLSIIYPELCKEWDYEKNYPLTPNDVSYASGKKVWWKCKDKHEWKDTVSHRTCCNRNCPYCFGHKLSDKNRLSVTHPELCKEWNYKKNGKLKPKDVSFGSAKKVWWICIDGHEWETSICNRTKGNNCPYCSGCKLSDKNRLSITHPELCKEWNYKKNGSLKPEDVSLGSKKTVWWKCKNGHEFEASVCSRTAGNGCPYCSGRKILYKYQLSVVYPELCKEWNYKKNGNRTPEDVNCNNKHVKVWWKCKKCGFEWQDFSYNRINGAGCPICDSKVPYKKRLSVVRPEIKKIWNYKKNKLPPDSFTSKSMKMAWFICPKGHEWERSIAHVSGCPYCDGKIAYHENCFAKKHPELLEEWNYKKNKIFPENVTTNSNKMVWWICKKGHEWEDTVCHRTSGRNCPYCSSHRVCKDNSLLTLNPDIAKEWHPTKNGNLTPNDVCPQSSKQVWWLCPNGHEYRTRVASRSNGNGCSKCNKIELKCGLFFDSMTEAYVYLKLKNRNLIIEQKKKYGFGKYKCDFYLPKTNTYIEATGFNKHMQGYGGGFWKKYYKKIMMKKKYVKKIGANFKFIQIKLSKKQIDFVRKNMK